MLVDGLQNPHREDSSVLKVSSVMKAANSTPRMNKSQIHLALEDTYATSLDFKWFGCWFNKTSYERLVKQVTSTKDAKGEH